MRNGQRHSSNAFSPPEKPAEKYLSAGVLHRDGPATTCALGVLLPQAKEYTQECMREHHPTLEVSQAQNECNA